MPRHQPLHLVDSSSMQTNTRSEFRKEYPLKSFVQLSTVQLILVALWVTKTKKIVLRLSSL